MTIKERILHIAQKKGIPKQLLCEKIGLTYGGFTGENKKRPVNSDAIANLLVLFPDISPLWLVTGNGEMLTTETKGHSVIPEVIYRSDPRDAEILAANKEVIETQKELIISLKQRIKDLEHGSSYAKTDAFPSAHSAASTGRAHPRKPTK